MQELVQKKLVKSAAVCTLICRMASVLIDSSAVSKLFSIALLTQKADQQAYVVELLAVRCLTPLFVTCSKTNRSVNIWQCLW